MLDNLVLHNFPSGYEPQLKPGMNPFIMSTCQRTLIVHYGKDPMLPITAGEKFECKIGNDAYAYLLEIICGLKSKMVGENEIVGQFKQAYKSYVQYDQKNSKLLAIIEKLFKDAKEIRSNYLLGLSQKTYSSIARKHIVSKHKADSVLILGSGQLAEDLINQFKKKINVFISARNQEKVLELASEHNIEIIPWGDEEMLKKFPYIANSIGFKGTLLDEDFFHRWSRKHDRKLFVDLGSPSAIETQLNYNQGVMKLDDVFEEGAVHETHKKQQIEKARMALDGIVEKRHRVFKKKLMNNPNNKADLAYV
jgi:glutamyl-tRNA reductase